MAKATRAQFNNLPILFIFLRQFSHQESAGFDHGGLQAGDILLYNDSLR